MRWPARDRRQEAEEAEEAETVVVGNIVNMKQHYVLYSK